MDLKITVHMTDNTVDNCVSIVSGDRDYDLECMSASEIKDLTIGELIRLLSES